MGVEMGFDKMRISRGHYLKGKNAFHCAVWSLIIEFLKHFQYLELIGKISFTEEPAVRQSSHIYL